MQLGIAAALDQAAQFAGVFGKGAFDRLAQQAAVAAVARQQRAGAEDTDMALAVVQLAIGLLADLLQAGQADIDAHHADDLAVEFQREGDAGHQRFLPADLVVIGFQYAGLTGLARAGVPGVVGHAVVTWRGVAEQFFGHGLGFQLANRGLCPVQREAPCVIAAQVGLVGEQLVLAVQSVGFEHQVQAEQGGVGFQAAAHLAGQVLAQVEGIEKALLSLLAQKQDLPGEPLAVLVGVHEVTLDANRL